MNRAPATLAAVLLAALVAAAGCAPEPVAKLNDRLSEKQGEIDTLRAENEAISAELAQAQQQVETLQQLGDKRIEYLPQVARIELVRYTGSIDTDGRAGHDAIKVYLRPIDRHGHPYQAAGTVRVRLFDLAAEPDKTLLAERTWGPEELPEHWSSGLMTNHYNLECPLPAGRPASDQITVRAEFTDYLTGLTHAAQRPCRIILAPAAGE